MEDCYRKERTVQYLQALEGYAGIPANPMVTFTDGILAVNFDLWNSPKIPE